ncbi:hypothetical protein NT2_12_01080 [Caenibius tardaugens NBRC 16725]|uniref:Uncharacterized protein n=2 Tax=Caenibius TaxID=2827482 RepID=U3A7Y3_9SPHN|nr:hypothetical protein NT2_12_01080 [Caenibius tardaugens NBRC 16725]
MLLSLPVAALAAQDAGRAWWHADPRGSPPPFIRDAQTALAAHAAQMLDAAGDKARAGQAVAAARAVLRAEPFDVAALRLLGIAKEMEAEGRGQSLLHLAERVSRRDLITQLALIEHAARAGDLAGTLRHYDRVLAVHPEVDEQLFPILAAALGEDAIRQRLVVYAKRDWFTRFAYKALSLGADPVAYSALLVGSSGGLDPELAGQMLSRVIGQLVAEGRFADAKRVAQELSGPRGGAMRDLGFTPATLDPRLDTLGWRLADNEIARAFLERDGRLSLRIASNRTGEMARRTTLLPEGAYRLAVTIGYQPDTPRARLTWDVRCRGAGGAVLWQAMFPVKGGSQELGIVVPPRCAAQEWRLSATSALSQFPSEAQVVALDLAAAR